MKKTVTKSHFMDEFRKFDRFEEMGGYDGLSTLFDYLIDLEEDIGTEIELDVIAICCDFTYYSTKEEVEEGEEIVAECEDGGVIVHAY